MWHRSVMLLISGCLTGCVGVQTPNSVYKAWIDYNSLAAPSASIERISHRPYRSSRVGEFAWMYNRPAGRDRAQSVQPLTAEPAPMVMESDFRRPVDLSAPEEHLPPPVSAPGFSQPPPPPAPPADRGMAGHANGSDPSRWNAAAGQPLKIPRVPAMPLGRGLFANPPPAR